MQVPFHIVQYQDALLSNGFVRPEQLWMQYNSLLKICGWTRQQYELQLLKWIDKEWIAIHSKAFD